MACFSKRLEFYCTDEQYEFVRMYTELRGISISEYMRSLVRVQMDADRGE